MVDTAGLFDVRLDRSPRREGECTHCGECGATTKEGKPLCSAHVQEMPYVRQVLAGIADQERDVERILQAGKVDLDGPAAREVLQLLERGFSLAKVGAWLFGTEVSEAVGRAAVKQLGWVRIEGRRPGIAFVMPPEAAPSRKPKRKMRSNRRERVCEECREPTTQVSYCSARCQKAARDRRLDAIQPGAA